MVQRSIRPLEKLPPLRQRVYDSLVELIIYGTLAPGEHLVEADIANRLGTSRIPVREALQLLHRDGWVDLRPRQGAFVHQPTIREVDDVFRVRTLLEAESARLAAVHADGAVVRKLRRVLESGTKALAGGDEKEVVKLNSRFHALVAEVADNQILAGLIARLDKRIRWYFAPVARSRGAESWREHRAITDAIAAADPDAAAMAMGTHAELTQAAYHAQKQGQEDEEAELG
jgi:DNA-binding GntR family transcriptional regulator